MALRRGVRGWAAGLLGLAVAACAAPTTGGTGANARASAKPNAAAAPVASPTAVASAAGVAGSSQLGTAQGAGRLFLPLRLTPVLPSSLLGNDGASLLANDGSSLLANDGSSLIGNDGTSLLANDGGSLIANDGSSLLANDGGSIVAGGSGNYRLAQADASASVAEASKLLGTVQNKFWRQVTSAFVADQLLWAWAKKKPRLGEWTRFELGARLLPYPQLAFGDAGPLLVGLLTKTLTQNLKAVHLATFWRQEGSAMVATTFALPRADAAASEGQPIFEMRTTKPGEILLVGNHLEKISDLPGRLGIAGLSLTSTYVVRADGSHAVDLLVAEHTRALTKDDDLFFMSSGLVKDTRGWQNARYEIKPGGHLSVRYAEHVRQNPTTITPVNPVTLEPGTSFPVALQAYHNLMAAQSGPGGVAAWVRFAATPKLEGPFSWAGLAPMTVYGNPAGGLNLAPSAELKATLPNDDLVPDSPFHLPVPTADEDPVDDPRFQIKALAAADFQATGAVLP